MDILELKNFLRDKKIRESHLELQRMVMGLNANNNYTDRVMTLKPSLREVSKEEVENNRSNAYKYKI
jgi:hypothetical protein